MRYQKLVFTISLLTLPIIFFAATHHISALSGSEWRAGRIIDDSIFVDKNSMSVDSVQAFLNSKVGSGGYDSVLGQCDTNGARNARPYSESTRAQYSASRGKSTKFTCLSNYYEVPKTDPGAGTPANNYGGKPIPAGAKSAAQLIWDAAQRYNISPKVLLVKIQNESAGPLTTDDWPYETQYTYALGAHCPDSGPGGSANCDSNYAGFSIQINEAARLMRYYLDNMNQPWWPYKKPGNNNVLWNVAPSGCGGSNVNIQTKATAALYTYTPYQPNQAALNNLYGTGDGCSAYGNRNFWRTYWTWFGTTSGNCAYPTSSNKEIFRVYQPNTNGYLITQDPSEVCNATAHYGYVYDGVLSYASSPSANNNVYRLQKNGNYLYTTSVEERTTAVQNYGFHYEGVAFNGSPIATEADPSPVYRLSYHPTGGYSYTMSSVERDHLVNTMGYTYEGIIYFTNNTSGSSLNDVFRLAYDQYVYTISEAERDSAIQNYKYRYEGVAFRTRSGFSTENLPVYRLASNSGYLFTSSLPERKRAILLGYRSEGIGYYAYPTSNFGATKSVYRLSHPSGSYLYTISAAERDIAVKNYGYRYEGIGFRIP